MSKGVGWWNHAQTKLIHSELFQIFLPIIQVFIQKDINHIAMTTILKLRSGFFTDFLVAAYV